MIFPLFFPFPSFLLVNIHNNISSSYFLLLSFSYALKTRKNYRIRKGAEHKFIIEFMKVRKLRSLHVFKTSRFLAGFKNNACRITLQIYKRIISVWRSLLFVLVLALKMDFNFPQNWPLNIATLSSSTSTTTPSHSHLSL